MPFVTITIPEVVESISRPIIFNIIDQIQDIAKIDKSAQIIFPGDTGKMQQAGSAIDNQNRQTTLTSDRNLQIEVDEDDDKQYMYNVAVALPEHDPIFIDKDVGVTLRPLYSTNKVTIKFKYNAPSRTEVKRWRDDIRMRISNYRDINLHTVAYHYLVPNQYIFLLKAIYNNKQRLLNNNQTFEQYLASNMVPGRSKLISDMIGQDVRLSVSETACRIVGIYGFLYGDLPDKPVRNEDTSTWTVEFEYSFQYEKPNMVSARYPIMVYNELLPNDYIAFWNTQYDSDNVQKRYSASIGALHNFESQDQVGMRLDTKAEVCIPNYDDFIPDTTPSSCVGIFNALCQVDETDKVSLMSLTDLGDFVLNSDILNFIQNSELPFITQQYASIFYLGLYSNNVLNETGTLVCNPDLSIQATRTLDITKQHHVRLMMVTDLSMIYPAFFERARQNPAALCNIIASLNTSLSNNPALPNIAGMPFITLSDFSVLYTAMTGLRYIPQNTIEQCPAQSTNTNATQTNMSTIYTYGGTLNDPFANLRGAALELFRQNYQGLKTVQRTYIIANRNPNN